MDAFDSDVYMCVKEAVLPIRHLDTDEITDIAVHNTVLGDIVFVVARCNLDNPDHCSNQQFAVSLVLTLVGSFDGDFDIDAPSALP